MSNTLTRQLRKEIDQAIEALEPTAPLAQNFNPNPKYCTTTRRGALARLEKAAGLIPADAVALVASVLLPGGGELYQPVVVLRGGNFQAARALADRAIHVIG